jgi:NTE family protein
MDEVRPDPTPLDALLDIHRVKQYFGVALELRAWARAARRDVEFIDVVRRVALPLPRALPTVRPPRTYERLGWPTRRPSHVGRRTRRVAVVTSGGSGALASIIGLARALEERDTAVSCWSLCSGAALFGFPLAAGLPAAAVADFALGLTADDLVELDWGAIVRAPVRLGRGLTGVVRGDRVEHTVRELLGDLTLGELPTPAYAPIWNVEHNRLDYLGPRTHPDVTVARAVRMALTLPPLFEPTELDGDRWCDGGIVDILPVHPVLDVEPRPDVVLAVNVFYPPGLRGEDATGWDDLPVSILELAAQVRTAQHVALARENLSRLRAEVPTVLLLEPVPYDVVRGTGLYRQLLDPRDWPGFIRGGYRTARAALTDVSLDGPRATGVPRAARSTTRSSPSRQPHAGQSTSSPRQT